MTSNEFMTELLTKRNDQSDRLTPRDQRLAKALSWAPWVAFPLITFTPSLIFLLISLVSASGFYFLMALTSFPFALIAGLITFIFLLVFRRKWNRQTKERLASDGITADEIDWFRSELTTAERRALKEMDRKQPLLADAYRETLALRLNASRVISTARRDLMQVERRISRVGYLRGADTAGLLQDLQRDRDRLQRIKKDGAAKLDETQARLQMIEAAASRGASWSETNYMLQRLEEGHKQLPLAVESAREEQQLREDIERELRNESAR
jgi:hypothetical protein